MGPTSTSFGRRESIATVAVPIRDPTVSMVAAEISLVAAGAEARR